MFSSIYDCFLYLLAIASLPKVLWKREKYSKSWRAKLGLDLPQIPKREGAPVFWIHAVSMGETRAAISLVKKLKDSHPGCVIVVSSITETGHEEAKRSLSEADVHFFLPLDFSSVMHKLVTLIKPTMLILMEGEFWYHLIMEAKKQGALVFVANGKISQKSYERFNLLPFFSKRLFGAIDHLCLQSACHKERFLELGVPDEKLTITGNLKFDTPIPMLTPSEKDYWKEELGLIHNDRVVTIGSTHPEEEECLLKALLPLWEKIPNFKLLLVPRHPERFAAVHDLLEKMKIPFVTYSKREEKTTREKVILVDAMGRLPACYQLSEVALVGGSYIRGVGGHNVFEPIKCGVPVIFGPHMESQRDFSKLILNAGAGRQLSIEELPSALLELLQNGSIRAHLRASGDKLAKEAQGSTKRTLDVFLTHLDRST